MNRCDERGAYPVLGGEIRHSDILLRPETSRVAIRPFMPADNPFPTAEFGASRIGRVIERVLGLAPAEQEQELRRVKANLSGRHRNVEAALERRFHEVCDPGSAVHSVTPEQRQLIAAFFTEEYSFEAVALFNPSIVPHPDQSGVDEGQVRFVLSLRAVGEGHVSSITFRTGTFGPGERIVVDPPADFAIAPHIELTPGGALDDPGVRLVCRDHEDLSAVVIFPVNFRQRHGLEDLRLTRFTEDDGSTSYIGTYTAVGGEAVRQELLRTTDFVTFQLDALAGRYAGTKGMALFPRKIDGAYAMLGRQDHENIWLLRSNRIYNWDAGHAIIQPRWPWEFVQLGNCGSPIELDEGWLVITHGVGAVRNYSLGACLLDKRDPARLLARTTRPLLVPTCMERDGYVPNVAYSCGALVHGRTLFLPYAVADSLTSFATMSVDWLLGMME